MPLAASELILNADNSIYHLNLQPQDIANTIITVGDPDRVATVSSFFDTIELKKGKREFLTHTGTYKGKRISVISTGIGTDNIDIVFNELDALVNVDFKNRELKERHTSLDLIRIGTSGAIQEDIAVDSFLLSEYAIGFDNLLHFYKSEHLQHPAMQKAFMAHCNWHPKKSEPYIVTVDASLAKKFKDPEIIKGFTATNVGFYGPQGRMIRLETQDADLNDKIGSFRYQNLKITNLEMETSGIYGLSKLLGHRAVSMNCILANRSTGAFSKNPEKATLKLIEFTLNKLIN